MISWCLRSTLIKQSILTYMLLLVRGLELVSPLLLFC